MGKPEGGTLHAHAEALDKLFQRLFDDPTLKVTAKSSGVDGDPWVGLHIKGRCPTAYDVPALYIVGKDRLMSPSATEGAPEAKVPGGILAHRNVVVENEASQNTKFDLSRLTPTALRHTCCPCLVIGTEGTTVQSFTAYLADRIYRTHICEFTLDGSLPSDENAPSHPKHGTDTAQLVRHGPHRHPSCVLSPPPRLSQPFYRHARPLPFHLQVLDRVDSGPSIIFTGKLALAPCADGDDCWVAVHIKFVDIYGMDAHRLLAEHAGVDGAPHPLAPKLY